MTEPSVRRAEWRDAVALHLVAAATFPLAVGPDIPAASVQEFIDRNLSIAQFRSWLSSDDHLLFIAEVDGTPAGYSMLSFGEAPEDVAPLLTTTPTVELEKLYLLAGRHGTGLASQLLDRSIAAAREGGVAAVWLGVGRENARANRFYERHGFEKRGMKKFAVSDDFNDEIIRELVL